MWSTTSPQTHRPSLRVTISGGNDVGSMICADAETAETGGNIVTKSSDSVGFGCSSTEPQGQAPPGKVTGYTGLAWQ